MEVTVSRSKKKPKRMPLAIELLEEIRRFYRDPEHEREFQEWKKQRESKE